MSSSFVLRGNRLAVEVAAPGSVYAGTRFDWTGFVTQVTLDDRHTFCMPESLVAGQGSGGIGLCGEFGIDRPIGYDDILPGQAFPKLGIGLLRRPDAEPYNFFRPYEIVQTFPIQIEVSGSEVRFVVEPLDCDGYAARLIKTLRIDENQLEVNYWLENVGRRDIQTNEYCHNFVGLNGRTVGPDYRLCFLNPVELELLPHMPPQPILSVSGRELVLADVPQRPFYCRLRGLAQSELPQWELVHRLDGVGLCEQDDFVPARVAVWGVAHVISAEVFVDIHLRPGQAQTWTRRYTFSSNGS